MTAQALLYFELCLRSSTNSASEFAELKGEFKYGT